VTQGARVQLADELLRRFAATVRSGQLYAPGHPIVTRNLESLFGAVQLMHNLEGSIVIGVLGDEMIVDETPMARGEALGGLVRRLKQGAVERIVIERGVGAEEIAAFVEALASVEAATGGEPKPFPPLPHIRVGRVRIEERVEDSAADMSAFKRLYGQAVSVAEMIWDSAATEGRPDASAARTMIEGLAQAVSQNRAALLALTTLKKYDNYTFTHMVNVSILTMGQARALGIDGPLLRELGLAALMHDIGKVRTPLEILNKPDKLTDEEFTIMKRHTVDGAGILRSTPDIAPIAPVVALEHHLRLDGSGYPRVKRASLNLGTMLCSIADVFDAMRSQRLYQQAYPSERAIEVMRRNDGRQFDQHLVRRFIQLIGIYPAGSLVRLDTGEVAVVATVYAPDPHRPHVKVVIARDGRRVDLPYDVNLWEGSAEEGWPSTVAAPLDPEDHHVDCLSLL